MTPAGKGMFLSDVAGLTPGNKQRESAPGNGF